MGYLFYVVGNEGDKKDDDLAFVDDHSVTLFRNLLLSVADWEIHNFSNDLLLCRCDCF